jgi:hypothetical protein
MPISANYPSIRPSLLLDFANTTQLDPRITFSRPTTARYYNANTTALAEQNLLFPSNTLSGGNFTQRRITVTTDSTVAPDGTSTASLVAEDTNTNTHGMDTLISIVTGNTYTKSVYVKKGTGATAPNIVQIATGVSVLAGGGYVNFDISVGGATSGTITASTSNVTGSIIFVGNGWYRCAVTLTATTGGGPFNEAFLYFTNNNPTAGLFGGSYAGLTTSDVFLWGAQVEIRNVATAFTLTTTAPITNYIPVLLTAPVNEARFDHNPVTRESLGLLIEEQRTNLFTYSSDFSNAAWTKTALNLTSNTIVAPDGTLTGSKISTTTGTFQSGLVSTGFLTSGNSSISVYAKASEAPILQIATFTYGNFQCYFNLTTGVSNGTAGFTRTMTDVGNGWWRCTVSGTLTASGNFIFIPMAVNSGLNPAPIGQGIYLWGAQYEAGSFATSYIPTEASQVIRSADVASMTGTNFSSWYNPAEGTLYAESASFTNTGSGGDIFTLTDSTNTNFVCIYRGFTSNFMLVLTNGTVYQNTTIGTVAVGVYGKVSMSYGSSAAGVTNGGTVVAGNNLQLISLNTARIFSGANGNNFGYIKKIAYYPIRVTNAQLQALTGS